MLVNYNGLLNLIEFLVDKELARLEYAMGVGPTNGTACHYQ